MQTVNGMSGTEKHTIQSLPEEVKLFNYIRIGLMSQVCGKSLASFTDKHVSPTHCHETLTVCFVLWSNFSSLTL